MNETLSIWKGHGSKHGIIGVTKRRWREIWRKPMEKRRIRKKMAASISKAINDVSINRNNGVMAMAAQYRQ